VALVVKDIFESSATEHEPVHTKLWRSYLDFLSSWMARRLDCAHDRRVCVHIRGPL